MITVLLKENEVTIKGHANQNEYGNDIVCASVSTAVYMTINQIILFNLNTSIEYKIDEGYTFLKLIKTNDVVNKIFKNLIYTLKDLEKQFSKYIKIE